MTFSIGNDELEEAIYLNDKHTILDTQTKEVCAILNSESRDSKTGTTLQFIKIKDGELYLVGLNNKFIAHERFKLLGEDSG